MRQFQRLAIDKNQLALNSASVTARSITLSLSTLKRACKRAELTWKRVRKSLKSKGDSDLFEQSQQQLISLIEQSQKKQID